jgi:hypothetical protein
MPHGPVGQSTARKGRIAAAGGIDIDLAESLAVFPVQGARGSKTSAQMTPETL